MTPRTFLLTALLLGPLATLASDTSKRFERAVANGFYWTPAQTFPDAYTGKGNISDDGPFGLPLLGGIGTGAFGRDLTGHFSRWHLQPGFARVTSVDAASLCVRWEQGVKTGAYRLGEAGWDMPLPTGARQVAVLWPIVAEKLTAADWPVEVIIESWSPVIPGNYEASALPVAFFDVHVRNTSSAPAKFDVALFMPNFLGWRKGYGHVLPSEAEQNPKRASAAKLGPRVWLERSNAGNYAEPLEPDGARGLLNGVLLRRSGTTQPTQDMEGQVLLGVGGGDDVNAQRLVCAFVNGGGDPSAASASCFLVNCEKAFFADGKLPVQEKGWPSLAHEVTASAVAGGVTLAPGAERSFTLVMVWDLPLVQFGSGRTWEKAYTKTYGADGRQARRIALDALGKRAEWRAQIDRWHTDTLGQGTQDELKRRGAAINDLSFVVSGGATWVAKEHQRAGFEPPRLGSGEHFSILEGFDTGYYFNSTFDLWPYAQPAFEANWPRLSELVLQDFLRAAPMAIGETRFITNEGRFSVCKVANKIPHDIGCPAGDPWHQINEYGSTRDSNVWKDHNPQFILSLYLHRRFSGAPPPTDPEWRTLLGITEFMIAQDKQHDGLLYHDAQGDNTWDALHFTGPSPYSGSLTIGAWAAMTEWAKQRGDAAQVKHFAEKLALSKASFEKYFWNGRYYRGAASGDQAEWVLSDALFGILMAEACGLRGLLPGEHIAAHLRHVADRNWRDFGKGDIGPSLLAPASGPIPNGGLQVGEVLVGSARACAAFMQRAGVRDQGNAMADAINRTLYEKSGLQFRTPAAWTAEGTFRAQANMRPLASWYSLWPDRQ